MDDIAVADGVLVAHDARLRPAHQLGQRSLALLERCSVQILAFELDDVEGAEDGRVVVTP
jgi:hypothetical protein